MAGGGDGEVAAFDEDVGLTDDKGLVGGGEVGDFGASEAQVGRAVVGRQCDGGCFGLVVVGRNDDGHARKHFHQSDVFEDLVRRTIFAEGEACVRGADFYVFVRVGNALADLVVDPSGREVGKGSGERNPAANGEARGHTHHVCLSDSRLKEALGEFLGEGVHLERTGEVSTKCDDVGVAASEFEQAGSESAAGVLASLVRVGVHEGQFTEG